VHRRIHGITKNSHSGVSYIGITSRSGSTCLPAQCSSVRNAAMSSSVDPISTIFKTTCTPSEMRVASRTHPRGAQRVQSMGCERVRELQKLGGNPQTSMGMTEISTWKEGVAYSRSLPEKADKRSIPFPCRSDSSKRRRLITHPLQSSMAP
jgi:hypothetical protein